jgi:hypothetical protein
MMYFTACLPATDFGGLHGLAGSARLSIAALLAPLLKVVKPGQNAALTGGLSM